MEDQEINESELETPIALARTISRLANRFGRQMAQSTGDKLVRLNSALLLLNQAQLVASKDVQQARQLLATARRVGSSGK